MISFSQDTLDSIIFLILIDNCHCNTNFFSNYIRISIWNLISCCCCFFKYNLLPFKIVSRSFQDPRQDPFLDHFSLQNILLPSFESILNGKTIGLKILVLLFIFYVEFIRI